MPGSLPPMRRLERTRPIPRISSWSVVSALGRRAPRIATPLWKGSRLNKSTGSSRSRLHRLRANCMDLTRVAKLSGSSSSYIRKPEGSVQPTLFSTVRETVDLSYWMRPVLDSPSDLSRPTAAGSSLSHPCSQMKPGRRRSERPMKVETQACIGITVFIAAWNRVGRSQ